MSLDGCLGLRKEGVGEGLAEKVGKGLAKGWRRVGEGLAQGWRRVGEGLAVCNRERAVLRQTRVLSQEFGVQVQAPENAVKHAPPCSSEEPFFAEKRGPQRKDFGGRYGFPCFYRVFVSTTGLESFSLGQKI